MRNLETDSGPFSGDEVARTMSWKGEQTIKSNHRKVKFYLRNAELFSLRFVQAGGKKTETLW